MGENWALFNEGVKSNSFYRLMTVSSIASNVMYLVLLIAVWTAISQSATLRGGLDRVITYVIVATTVNTSVSSGIENFVGYRIQQGTIVNELKRPVSFLKTAYLHELGWQSLDALKTGTPLLVGGILLAGVSVPGLKGAALFLSSVFLAFNLVVLLALNSSMLIFWTKSFSGIRYSRSTLISLFSGALFPLYLLPEGLRQVFYLLPFSLMVDAPVRIYLGEVAGLEAVRLLGYQLAWIAAFYVALRFSWRKARNKLTVQGG